MGKSFFDVFQDFRADEKLQGVLSDVDVYRVVSNRESTRLTVYVRSSYLISKGEIRQIERKLSSQLFPEGGAEFRLKETFDLSPFYTSEILYNEYGSSIAQELFDESPALESILKRAGLSFSKGEGGRESTVTISLEDTVISRAKARELIEILDHIFNERCGVPTSFKVEYRSPEPSKAAKNAKLRCDNQVDQIFRRLDGLAGRSSSADEEYMSVEGASPLLQEDAPSPAKVTAQNEGAASGTGTVAKGSKKVRKASGIKKSDDPDLLYGRNFTDRVKVYGGETRSIAMDIADITSEIDEVVIRGRVIAEITKDISNDRKLLILTLTDYEDSILVKLYMANEDYDEIHSAIHNGGFYRIKGKVSYDTRDRELMMNYVTGVRRIPDFTVKRTDNSPEKRVELHCHTKMSDMDGVSDVKDIIARAKSWGMKSLAITDHGVVQAFTDAGHAVEKDKDFKIIYGVEGYLVDDERRIVTDPKGQELMDTYVVFDIETTGFSPVRDRIIEIGAVKVSGGLVTDRFSAFVNPERPVPFRITRLTGIDDSMVKDAQTIETVLPRFLDFCCGAVLVAHNAPFDSSFIKENAARLDLPFDYTVVDTVMLSRYLLSHLSKYDLETVSKDLGVVLEDHHRAVNDAECTAEIFIRLSNKLSDMGVRDMDELDRVELYTPEVIKKMHSYHVIILAKNDTGRVNLYKLISLSHLDYFRRFPRLPKSLVNANREGLIVGSACEAGELFRAVLRGEGGEELARIASFYDYFEIQPIGNNAFLLRENRDEKGDDGNGVSTEEDLKDLNRRIVELGEKFGKPVCATCDVHFLDPQDEVYRRIIMAGKGFKDADDQAPLFLRTTEEMLDEFSYLGHDKAQEVVIDNTNLIADMVDRISPVRPDKCPPVIERSDEDLREMCLARAHEIYGEKLPPVVEERMEKELHSIISNGFAVMYIIAQKLVLKSNEDGYLVGSRGSVGSSFVAYLAGITEVNSLSPHYYCGKCHYSDFDSEEVRAFAGMAGCDMPDKLCPVCGAPLKKDGFDIPFETFLGFKGDKEPDIDLNFSGEYQAQAHKYTEVIFGKGHTFKAGTVGTLADKTAYGYVKKYYAERGISKKKCEIERITMGCTGIKRTTGQHPGGIVVLPHGEEIYYFTPVQNPANDSDSGIITTHFDYHSIDHNLLKLDILGHDDPTMIRFLQDKTGVDPRSIPLDDPKVMSLFESTDALGISPEDIDGCPLGALGIPEFGTSFAMQMLCDTKPKYFSDLVRIAGLSHGTDVYLGNAETLIKEGTATISTAICTRDDIMIYLIGKGVDPAKSFKIMESVRKGKVANGKESGWDEWKKDMSEHGVPDWYIWSCEKIKYMFPKAHAAAYVMMAWRIAWFKINYPLEYYAAFFSIRADDFSYELMCQGREKLEYNMKDYQRRAQLAADNKFKKKTSETSEKDEYTPKMDGQLKVMKLVQEMYARGFDFMPIDFARVKATEFQVIDGALMPSLSSIDGIGEAAAASIEEKAREGRFLSLDDFKEKTGANQNVCELVYSMGLLGDIPRSNQMSIFDIM